VLEDAEETQAQAKVSMTLVVNASALIALAAAIAGGAEWANGLSAKMDLDAEEHRHRLELLDLRIEDLSHDVKRGTADRWSRQDMLTYHAEATKWIELFGAFNPEMSIPAWPPLPLHKDN